MEARAARRSANVAHQVTRTRIASSTIASAPNHAQLTSSETRRQVAGPARGTRGDKRAARPRHAEQPQVYGSRAATQEPLISPPLSVDCQHLHRLLVCESKVVHQHVTSYDLFV